MKQGTPRNLRMMNMMALVAMLGGLNKSGSMPYYPNPEFAHKEATEGKAPRYNAHRSIGRNQRKRRALLRSNPHLLRSKKFR